MFYPFGVLDGLFIREKVGGLELYYAHCFVSS